VYRFIIGVFLSALINAYAGDQVTIAISSAPNNLVPFYSTDANSQNINRLVHKALIDFNEEMQFQCRACSSFEERFEGDKQILKFHLKKDQTFHDGTPVEAADVVRSWEYYAKNRTIASTFADSFENLREMRVLDKHTLEIVFSPFSLENASNLGLLKIMKLKKTSGENLEPGDVIGCGDYYLDKISPLEIVVKPRDLSKNTFVFKVVKDETTLALKLINKEIDLSVANMSPRKINWLREKADQLQVWEIPSGNYQYMGMNFKRDKFNDLNVRKAISHLVPREDLLKYKLKNTAVLSSGMFSPAFAELYEKGTIDSYDPKAAETLLLAAGWKKNKKGILEKNGEIFDIDWKVSNNKSSIEVAEVMQHYLEKAGFRVNISIQEWGTFMSSFKSGNFDIVVGQWIGFTGPDMMKFVFHSKSTPPTGGNRTSYNNPKFDKVIDAAVTETNSVKRKQLYKQALDIINQDYAYINLWHPNIIWVGSRCLKNLTLEPTGGFYPLLNLQKSHEGNCAKH